jgi:uncharacterized tellurite resistance protein B-like protein
MNRAQSIAFVRALAAVSWADGRLERAEESHLKSLAYRLGVAPEVLRREVQPLLERPVPYERALDIVGELVKVLGSAADRELFLTELSQLFEADGEFAEQEQRVFGEIEAVLGNYGPVDFVIGKLRGAVGSLFLGNRRQATLPAEFHPFAKNKVLTQLVERLQAESIETELSPAELNRAALEGALLAQVALADDHVIDDGELAALRRVLAERGLLTERELEVALAVLREGAATTMDRQRLCAEFNRVSTLDERRQLVDAMFAIAGTMAAHAIESEIRLLANFLWLPTRDYVDIRQRWEERTT